MGADGPVDDFGGAHDQESALKHERDSPIFIPYGRQGTLYPLDESVAPIRGVRSVAAATEVNDA